MPFAGGVSPPLPVVSLLFSASYPQDRRSYYLFFNYLFFNYLYSVTRLVKESGGGCYLFGTKLPFFRLPVWYWKTDSNHRRLWINLTVAIA